MKSTSRFLLATSILFSASNLYAATEFPSRESNTEAPSYESNQVFIDIPDDKVEPLPPLMRDMPAPESKLVAPDETKPAEPEPEHVLRAPTAEKYAEPEKPASDEPKLLGTANETAKPVELKGAESGEAKDIIKSIIETAPEKNSLREVLVYVYENHPQLLAEREKLKAIDESVAIAVSDFRPDISADYGKGRERQSRNGAAWDYGATETKGVVLNQPIFSGLDGVAALKAAKQRVKAARADLTAVEQQVLFNAIVAYTEVVEAQSVLALNQNSVDVLSKQREATSVRFDVGELTKTDVSQAEARLAIAKANEQEALGNLAIARAQFLRTVGYEAPEKPSIPEVPPGLPETLEQAISEARAASPVLEAARHREKAFAEDVDVRVGEILPDVSLQAATRRSEGGNVIASRYKADALTLNVAIPLYQSGAEWARLRESRNLASQARFNTIDTTLAVDQDVNSAWQNFVTAGSLITSNEAAARAAEMALEGVRQESDYGVRTVLDTLDAEQEYLNTQVNLVRVIRNHKIQAYRLLASVGKLTAKELSLPVKLYDPKDNYDKVKYQLLGW